MRKLLFLFLAFFAFESAQAQSKIGIKFAPTLSSNRIDFTGEGFTVSSNGVGGRFIFGPIFDFFIDENYYLSTGLLYAPKRIGITVTNTNRSPNAPGSATIEESYNLQYLQLPATLKLFTNELALDTRVYFQLGGILDVKIAQNVPDNADRYLQRLRFFDFSLHLGSGVEYRMGYNTLLFGGIFYNRGLINPVTRTFEGGPDINVKNDLIGLELGVKF